MRSPILALLWERWRRTRYGILAAFLLPISFAAWTVYETYPGTPYDAAPLFIPLGNLLLVGYLLFSHCDRDDIYLAFPRRLLRLPIRTRRLVALHIGYSLAALAVYGLTMYLTVRLSEDGRYWWLFWDWEELTRSLILSLSGFVFAQTICWILGPITLTGTLTVVVVVYAGLADLFTDSFLSNAPLRDLTSISVMGLLFSVLLCCLASIKAVSWQRRGAWEAGFKPRFAAWLQRRWELRGRFRSPLHAQIWYEWRRSGRFLPAIFASLCVAAVLGLASTHSRETVKALVRHVQVREILSGTNLPPVRSIEILWTLIAALGWAAGCASLIGYAMSDRDRASGMLSFLFVRPLSTRALAAAKFRAAFRTVLFSIGVLVLMLVLCTEMSGWTLAEFFRYWGPQWKPPVSHVAVVTQLFGYLVLGILGGALLTWTILWLTPAILLYSCLVYWPLASVIDRLVLHYRWPGSAFPVLLLTLNGIIVFVTSLVLLHRARRKGSLTPKALLLMVALAPLVAAGIVLLIASGQLDMRVSDRSLPGFLLLCTPLPFVPVAAIPLVLDRLRHR